MSQNIEITGGFSRSTLPQTLALLRPSMVYNVTTDGSASGTVNDGGVQLNLGSGAGTFMQAHSGATGGATNVMWMQSFAASGNTLPGMTHLQAYSSATGSGSDAELGVQQIAVTLNGSNELNGRADIAATASAGGRATSVVQNVNISVNSSGTGTQASPLSSYAHMGEGEGASPGVQAIANGSGSVAAVNVTGNISLVGNGDDAYAYSSGFFAQGLTGGQARVDIGGNVALSSTARAAHTYALFEANNDGSAGSLAAVHVAGDLTLTSVGTESAMARLAMRTEGAGTIDVDGAVRAAASGPDGRMAIQLISTGSSDAQIAVGSIDMNVGGTSGGHGWLDVFTDHAGGIRVGDVNITVAASSDASLYFQFANNASGGENIGDATYRNHADSNVALDFGNANLQGTGAVHMFFNSETFGTISRATSISGLDLHYQIADRDLGLGTAPLTTITNFNAPTDSIVYNGAAATGANFVNAGTFSTLAAMDIAMNAALDGTHRYVFAVYNGSEDINRNGLADDNGAGVLAWDDDGAGISSVLVLINTPTLTPADLA